MPYRQRPPCAVPGCSRLATDRGRCPDHQRGTAASRGYGYSWQQTRAAFLHANSWCIEPSCDRPAEVADHDPVTRAELVRRGDPDPDAWHHLVPRCGPCHSRKTALLDGGFGR